MAENLVLKKLSEQLTCPVCLDAYKDPKVLDCHHVFCCQCLDNISGHRRDIPMVLSCPTCRQDTPLPERSVGTLKSAFHIHSLFDIRETLLEQQPPSKVSESTALLSTTTGGEHCPNHPDRSLEMYCDKCELPICCACVVSDHVSHPLRLIADIIKQKKETLSLYGKMLEQQLQVSSSLIEKAGFDAEHVKQNRANIEEKIKHYFEMFHKLLNARQEELISELDSLSQRKLDTITARLSSLQDVETRAKQALNSTQVALGSESEADAVIVTAQRELLDILQQLSTKTINFSNDNLVKPELSFYFGQNDVDLLTTISRLYSQTPSAQNSILRVPENAANFLNLGESFSFMLDIKDQYGACIKPDLKEIKAEICGHGLAKSSLVTPPVILKSSKDRYKVSSTPLFRGRHMLTVTINGENVIGSPCQLSVCPPPNLYSACLLCVNNLKSPWGVAITNDQQVVLTENKSHRLLFFSQESDIVQRSVGKGFLHGTFQQPASICVDSNNQLYVTEQHTFAIKKCDSNGTVLKSVGFPGTSPLRFMSPMGVCVNPKNGKLYVADMENNRIQVLTTDLTFDSIITGSSDSKHSICLPSDIAFEDNGTMYVTDNKNHCVHVYSPSCEHLRVIGREGKKRGQLRLPFGICLDGKGHIFVAEALNDRVSIFKTCGEFVQCFGSHGTQPGQFNMPQKVAIDNTGYLYVTDTGNNRMQVF